MYKLYISKNKDSKEFLKEILKENNINSNIIYNENNKPYLENSNYYFNISHSKDYIVCVLSNNEIGIDIEKITYKENIVNRFFNEKEKIKSTNSKEFTIIWTKKESYLKCLGLSTEYGLKNIDTTILEYDVIDLEDYIISIYEKK